MAAGLAETPWSTFGSRRRTGDACQFAGFPPTADPGASITGVMTCTDLGTAVALGASCAIAASGNLTITATTTATNDTGSTGKTALGTVAVAPAEIVPVPTMTHWSLVTLSLLLLAAGCRGTRHSSARGRQ